MGTDSMLLGAFCDASFARSALDLGAGTGVLSLMIAQKNPELLVDAIELDEQAAVECRFNFEHSAWSNRLEVLIGNYLTFPFNKRYDLIISNPPYHLEEVLSDKEETERVKRTNLQEIDLFFDLIQKQLNDVGKCWLILPYVNNVFFQTAWEKANLYCLKRIIIHAKPTKRNTRMIIVLGKYNTSRVEETEFFIREENNTYSKAYISLTSDFHAKDLSL